MQFNEKVVLITGGAAGIGRSAALKFAAEGAQVLITGRTEQPMRDLCDAYKLIDYLVADISDPSAAVMTIEKTIARFGRLDVLVNNAGAGAVMPLADVDNDFLTQLFAVNVFGPSLLAKEAQSHLVNARGCIVNVSSTYGHKAAANLSHYAASKAALEHLTRCWALELSGSGVRVNAVAAGPTETEFLAKRMGLTEEQVSAVKTSERARIPLGRRGEPDDVAQWIVALASPSASWVTGQIITVDGGLNIT